MTATARLPPDTLHTIVGITSGIIFPLIIIILNKLLPKGKK